MLSERNYTYLGTTTGMCRKCRSVGPSRILEERGKVYQERLCPACGNTRSLIAESFAWYADMTNWPAKPRPGKAPRRPVKDGCPHDCGPCDFHEGCCNSAAFSVTGACDMRCPACFTCECDDTGYFMTRGELRSIVDGLVRDSAPLDQVNLTGGEPTLHPDLAGLVEECRRPGIGRITLNSNGIRLATDGELCRRLAGLGVHVTLSLDTLRPETSVKIHGKDVTALKLAALDNLEKHGIGTALLHAMVRGLNDGETGDIVGLALSRTNVHTVTIQTMTWRGQGGVGFPLQESLPVDEAEAALERGTAGRIKASDFFPLPAAHPLCYGVACYLRGGKEPFSLTRLFDRAELRELIGPGCLMRPLDEHEGLFASAIARFRARGGDDKPLDALRGMVSGICPPGPPGTIFERQRLAGRDLLGVYIHARMDEATFDISRVAVCPDHVAGVDGRMAPACAYSLFHRTKHAESRRREADKVAGAQARRSG